MRKSTLASLLILCGSTAAIAQVTQLPSELQANNLSSNTTTVANDAEPLPTPAPSASPTPDPMDTTDDAPPNATM